MEASLTGLRTVFLIALVVFIFGGTTQSVAETSSVSVSASVAAEPTSTEFSGSLKMEGTQYTTPLSSQPQLNQTQSVIGNFHLEKKQGTKAVVDFVAGENVSVGASHFGVSEIYFGSAPRSLRPQEGIVPESTSYAVGRKLEYWSVVDGDWQLGQWQPTYGELDVLRPTNQGLTGVFFKTANGPQELMLFATPIFIPSMGPQLKEQNGSVESDSRWYNSPSPNFPLWGVVTQVVYSLDIPDAAKLAANPGLGARYYLGESRGAWLSANYGHKPINSLLLRYRTILRTPEVGSRGEVTVVPSVGYHDVGGLDFGYKFDSGMVAASFLADQPSNNKPDDNWFLQQPEPFQATGLHIQRDFDLPALAEPMGISLNYLKIFGGKIHDVDSQNSNVGGIFENRFNYTNAASIKAEVKSYVYRKRLISSIKYLREFDQRGALMNGEFRLFPARSWAVSVGFDILGVDDESSQDGTFLNQFRANDRYYGGLSYVF